MEDLISELKCKIIAFALELELELTQTNTNPNGTEANAAPSTISMEILTEQWRDSRIYLSFTQLFNFLS